MRFVQGTLKGIVALGIACFAAMAQPAPARAGAQRAAVKSPDVQADGSVIFRLRAPDAKVVKVTGDFLASGTTLDAVRNDEGVWEAKSSPLPSDMWTYNFMVDGVRALDPSNPAVVRDGMWSKATSSFRVLWWSCSTSKTCRTDA